MSRHSIFNFLPSIRRRNIDIQPPLVKTNNRAADYFQFMKYPSNPKTNLKDEYEALKKQRDEEMEWEKRMAEKRESGREEYKKQLRLIQASSGATARGGGGGGVGDDADDANNNTSEPSRRKGWFDWFRGRTRGGSI